MWVYFWFSKLPDTYQEVEYIETTGTQYINTWLFAYNKYLKKARNIQITIAIK